MQTDQFWLKGACNVVTFAFANVQANFTTINTTLCKTCDRFKWSVFMPLLSFLLFIIIIIMCTHVCRLANACSHSLVSAFSHSMSAHMHAVWSAHSCTAWSAHICSVWSAHICSAWPAHNRTALSVHSLCCAYSRSLVSAQLAHQRVFAVWSAHSLVNVFSRSLVSVVVVISVCNIRWPFSSKETFCSSECVEF